MSTCSKKNSGSSVIRNETQRSSCSSSDIHPKQLRGFFVILMLGTLSSWSWVGCAAQTPSCAQAMGNVSQCHDFFMTSNGACGMNLSVPLPTCSNCTGRPSGTSCPTDPAGRDPCMFNIGENKCESSGFNCSYYVAQDGCNSAEGYHGSQSCAWDVTTSSCKDCSAFSTTNCPTPQCLVNSTSTTCDAVGNVCYQGARNSPRQCAAVGSKGGCYYDLNSNECIPCLSFRTQSTCTGISPTGVCTWNADLSLCAPRPECSTFSTSTCPGHCTLSAGGSCLSPLTVCANLTSRDDCIADAATLGCTFVSSTCLACLNYNQADCLSYSNCTWVGSGALCVGRLSAAATGGGGSSPGASTSSDLSTGAIIGVAFGVAGFLLIFGLILYWMCFKKPNAVGDETIVIGTASSSAGTSQRTTVHLTNVRLTMPTQAVQSKGASSVGGGEDEREVRGREKVLPAQVANFEEPRGANGSVYSCILPDGTLIAMKEVLLPSSSTSSGDATELFDGVMKEVSIVSSLDHPHVVRFFGSALEPEEHRLTIFMEMVPNGSLASMVRHMPEPMKEEVARVYVRQLV
ncbi:protein kinase, putative, partial [Bodo saltans]